MSQTLTPDPTNPELPTPATPTRDDAPPEDAARPSRYDANLRLIHRRLEDEKRTAKPRRWWRAMS